MNPVHIPVNLDVPVRAREASALADLIFQFTEHRAVDEPLRRMLAARTPPGAFPTLIPHWGSLNPDPISNATFYIAADGLTEKGPVPVLLHIALASAPSSGLFHSPILIGRMRTDRGLEVVVNAIPFSPQNEAHILTFLQQIDKSLLPGPQGVETFFLAAHDDAAEAFTQFRAIQRKYGLSAAAWTGNPTEALWAAIRSGWRHGFALLADSPFATRTRIDAAHISLDTLEDCIENLRRLHGRSHDIEVVFDPPGFFTDSEVLSANLARLRSRGRSIQVIHVEAGFQPGKPYPKTPDQMEGFPDDILSNVQWKAAGKPLAELKSRLESLRDAAALHGAVIALPGYAHMDEELLETIGAATRGRLWFQLEDIPSSQLLTLAASLKQ
jgi:hypothetical protein